MTDEAIDVGSREEYRQSLIGFFPDLTREEFAELSPHLELRAIPTDTVISGEGERVAYLGLLIDGRLSVRKANEFSDRPVLVAILGGGAVFGEGVLTGNSRADVTLAAMEESRVLLVGFDKLEEIIRDNPALGVKILSRCLKVCSKRLQGATARIVDIL